MIRVYPVVLILQVFCFYHAYKHGKRYYWYLIILFFPLFGALVYLFLNFGTRANLETVAGKIIESVKPNYEVEQLLKESKFTDTIANKIKLADIYASKQKYLQAISLYESCLIGYNSDDLHTKEKLMVAKYFIKDYAAVVKLGEPLKQDPHFRKSESRIVYAWSLHFLGRSEEAEKEFEEMDIRFGNYPHRIDYSKFLIETGRKSEARLVILSMQEEIEHMEKEEQRQKSMIFGEVKALLKSLA